MNEDEGAATPPLTVRFVAAHSRVRSAKLRLEELGVPVKDQIALSDAAIRRNVAAWIMALFGIVNLFMLGFIVWLAWMDHAEMVTGLIKPADRLVDNKVVIALLGATTVQLGAIAVIITKFVFKSPVDGG